ncbi:unnamed protein product [Prorocentrum cordatum]|uniref:Uncharacterized protein n=1 Tax=Prorocentrum cordatum TaxID=2364126 RepID=A0ABN9TAW9_9DINO|nr:unnamed protein product [Polarella glacialis]
MARSELRCLQDAERPDAHHGSATPMGRGAGAESAAKGCANDYIVCKSCGEWWWSSRLEGMNHQCTCCAFLPKPKTDKSGKGSDALAFGGGGRRGSGAGKSKAKGAEQVTQAPQLLADLLEALNLHNGGAFARALQGAASAIQAAVPEPSPKSRAERLGGTAKALQVANLSYSMAFAAKQNAEEVAAAARTKLEADAAEGILEPLVDGEVQDLAAGQLAANIDCEFDLSARGLDEEGRAEIEVAKRAVVAHMKENAQTFSTQPKDHLATAKLKAAEQQAPGARRSGGGADGPPERALFCASLQRWGPTAKPWMAKQKLGQGCVAHAFQETRVGASESEVTECELVYLGYKAASITVISLYLDAGAPPRDGINAREVTALAAFLKGPSGAWVVCGGFN